MVQLQPKRKIAFPLPVLQVPTWSGRFHPHPRRPTTPGRISPKAPASRGRSSPKVGEDGRVKPVAKRDAFVAASDLRCPDSCAVWEIKLAGQGRAGRQEGDG